MKTAILLVLLVAGELLGTVSAFAATYYVRAGASGANNGSDWANAYPTLPATLVRGSTYYVGDGNYPAYTFDDKVSGTVPIVIRKAIHTDHGTDTGWQSNFGDGEAQFGSLTFATGYYVFDGATGGGPGSWETGFGFKIKTTDTGKAANIYFGSGVSDITFRHVDFEGRGRSYTGGDTDLIYLVSRYQNITISYCFLHDTDRTMILSWPSGGSGLLIEHSKFARNGSAEHREAWSAGTDSNVTVRYNLFEDIMGTGVIAIVNNSGDASNWNIYGNVFYWTGAYRDGIINTGVIFVGFQTGNEVRAVNWNVYNNVFANIQGFTSAVVFQKSVNSFVRNNIWYSNRTDDAGVSGATGDYNWFYGNVSSGGSSIDAQSRSGSHDVIGTENPFVSWKGGDWRLVYPIPGIALDSQFAKDPLGYVRGTDGVWDRGAFEFIAGGFTAPTNLRIVY